MLKSCHISLIVLHKYREHCVSREMGVVTCFLYHTRYCVHGPRHRDMVEELVRREVERCDRLAGLMAMMSVAGGTGSGVGTYVTQCLRDIYPSTFILNHLTWPYGTGEVRILLSSVSFLMLE